MSSDSQELSSFSSGRAPHLSTNSQHIKLLVKLNIGSFTSDKPYDTQMQIMPASCKCSQLNMRN